ncbi:uncharacterized protein LOC143289110 [Babylonia areolata]|uniref:uncharacterized protein LOC143289110 n=1 Tax=Babylonia areolata TaxID=304850 RepID=UPI003FD451F5
MDRTFEYRTRNYRACVMLLMLGTVLTAVGFATSHWVDRGPDTHYGLWTHCSVDRLTRRAVCAGHDGSLPHGDLLRIPQILITLEITGLAASCIVAVVVNCRRYVPRPRNRYLEISMSVGGLLGLIGCSLFWSRKDRQEADQQVVSMLSWSFFLVFLDSIVFLVLACVIGCGDDVIPGIDDDDNNSLGLSPPISSTSSSSSSSPSLSSSAVTTAVVAASKEAKLAGYFSPRDVFTVCWVSGFDGPKMAEP